jgi:hypothetical protein
LLVSKPATFIPDAFQHNSFTTTTSRFIAAEPKTNRAYVVHVTSPEEVHFLKGIRLTGSFEPKPN